MRTMYDMKIYYKTRVRGLEHEFFSEDRLACRDLRGTVDTTPAPRTSRPLMGIDRMSLTRLSTPSATFRSTSTVPQYAGVGEGTTELTPHVGRRSRLGLSPTTRHTLRSTQSMAHEGPT